jgi:hypothetical protein
MCHLYGATGDTRCLERAGAELDRLVGAASMARNGGLGWLEAELGSDALCGFSHGASGIAFVMAELAEWAPQPAAAWLAGLAFRYEEPHFVREWGNWRDLRQPWLPEHVQQAMAAYKRCELDYFTRGSDTAAWCHGAPGIALARLRAWQALGGDHHRSVARVALARTTRSLLEGSYDSDILCHGRCGNASVLVEASRALHDESLLVTARGIAGAVAGGILVRAHSTSWRSYADSPGLFAGAAGAGYFLLEAADPAGTPSVLSPRLARQYRSPSWMPRALANAEWMVARTRWPCTTRVLEARADKPAEDLTAAVRGGKELRDALRALVPGEPEGHPGAVQLQEAWGFDEACEAVHDQRVANTHTFFEAHAAATSAHAALEEGIDLDAAVRWSPQVDLRSERWPWELVRANEPADLGSPGEWALLIRRVPGGVSVRRLRSDEAVVMAVAKRGARIELVIAEAEARGMDAAADTLADLLLRGELVLASQLPCVHDE